MRKVEWRKHASSSGVYAAFSYRDCQCRTGRIQAHELPAWNVLREADVTGLGVDMRLELLPLVFGILFAAAGFGLIFDAWTPDDLFFSRERRRRPRAVRHRGGEAAIGFGVMGMGAAFLGRDTWRYSIVTVIVGAALLLYGIARNWRLLAELVVYRGTLRRRDADGSVGPRPTDRDEPPDG